LNVPAELVLVESDSDDPPQDISDKVIHMLTRKKVKIFFMHSSDE